MTEVLCRLSGPDGQRGTIYMDGKSDGLATGTKVDPVASYRFADAIEALDRRVKALEPKPEPPKPRYCVDCKHFRRADQHKDEDAIRFGECARLGKLGTPHVFVLAPGVAEGFAFARLAREWENSCGTKGRYFERRPPDPPSMEIAEPKASPSRAQAAWRFVKDHPEVVIPAATATLLLVLFYWIAR